MSAHIRMQQSPSRCNARLRRSHSSPDRWPSPSPELDPSAHSGGKGPYHGLITVPSIGPPFPAHPAGATQVPVGVRRKASDTSSLCPHSPRSNSLMVALTTASNGPAIRFRCACSPVWEQLLMTCHAESAGVQLTLFLRIPLRHAWGTPYDFRVFTIKSWNALAMKE
jgi:hypothetical protein